MRIPRRNLELNDAIEVLDQHLIAVKGNATLAWQRLLPDEITWIDTELDRALDLRYYLENYHTIKTESGILKTLYPFWDHQEILYEAIMEEWDANGYCKIIVLKPRQTGISVWTAASMFHRTIFTPHCFTMIVAQNGDTSTHLYNMSINAYYNLPWWMRPEYLYKTKTGGIEFQRSDENARMIDPGLGSMMQVSPANQTSGVAIGRTIRCFHGSECSRWPSDEIYEGDIKPSLNAQDSYEVEESTAFGRQGLFYDQWSAAEEGESEMRPVFIPVYKVRKYSKPIIGVFELTEEEKIFSAKVKKEDNFEIKDEFWNWRRARLRAAKRIMNGKTGFLESYPLTPQEAFQASGLCAFDRDSLEWQQNNKVTKPLWAGEISLVSLESMQINTGDITPVADDEHLPKRKSGRGGKRFWIWEWPEKQSSYYLSMDVALGNGGDYTVIEVWRAGTGREPDTQVAEWWGWIPPKRAAHVAAAIGIFYNTCEIACEYKADGVTTGNELRDMDYPNLYRPQFRDRITQQASNYLHWVTNEKTRDEIIGCMNEALLDRSVVVRSEDLIDEMIDFGAIDVGGKQQGQGNEDDGCMASMIGLFCLRETMKHLKALGAQDEKAKEAGIAYIYGVYDNLMRQRGQYNTEAEAKGIASKFPGWSVKPIMKMQANTIFSPIFDAMNSEFELHQQGLHSTEITPDVVYAYRSAMQNFTGLPMAVGAEDDWG